MGTEQCDSETNWQWHWVLRDQAEASRGEEGYKQKHPVLTGLLQRHPSLSKTGNMGRPTCRPSSSETRHEQADPGFARQL